MLRKSLLQTFIFTTALTCSASPTFAAETVSIVVPFSAGGPTDFIARHFAPALEKELNSVVIIENRPGASGNIGTQYVVNSKKPELTLVHSTPSMQAVNPLMYPQAKFHPQEDLIPVGITGAMPNVLVVHPDSEYQSLEKLLDASKTHNLTYATFGPGSSPHIYGASLQYAKDFEATAIPYKGSGDAIVDMLAGRIDFMFDSLSTSIGHIQSQKLTPLAITSKERSPLLPNTPTLSELGIDNADLNFWFALQVNKNIKPEELEKLRKAIYEAAQDPEYIAAIKKRGVVPFQVAPDQLSNFVNEQYSIWTEAANTIDLKAD